VSDDNTPALDLSIVAPVFNEEDSIVEFALQLRSVLDGMRVAYEVVFVDDGSSDQSVRLIGELHWPAATVISFVANAGHMAALDAGYRAAKGKYVITMDSDLQHPPDLLPVLYTTAVEGGLDVVYAARETREQDGWFKKTSALLYYRFMRSLTDVDVQSSAADFRLVSHRVVDVVRSLPPGQQVFRLLIPSLGFPSSTVLYEANARFAGESKYTMRRMLNLSTDSVIGFTTKPLTISIRLGLVVSLLAVLGFIYVIITYFTGRTVEGWASVLSTVLLLFGILFVVLGVFGMYMGAILRASMAHPRYVIGTTAKGTARPDKPE
jgi:glycosyltransferase involved in cell wall biosynthesis